MLADKLVHTVTIVTPVSQSDLDDYGQPVPGIPTTEVVAGLVYPTRTSERIASNDASAMSADHDIVIALRDVRPDAHVLFGGERYDIRGVEPYAMGRDPLVVLRTRRVAPTGEPVGS